MEFIVSGSATSGNNRLEQYSNGHTSNLTTSKRTMTSTENTAYNETINVGPNQSYAPYFIVSLHDKTVREGESVLLEIVVSGKD